MKILLALICIVFYATCITSHEIRVKRGLSADEQKKLVDALNKDRQEVGSRTGLKMKQIVYNTTLESRIKEDSTCIDARGTRLRWNKVLQEIFDRHHNGQDAGETWAFFLPYDTSIACSKTFHCSQTLTKEDEPEFVGKTVEMYGLCVFYGENSTAIPEVLYKTKLPPNSKYADILGVPMPGENKGSESETKDENLGSGKMQTENQGSGRVFNFLIFLFMVIYI